MQAETGSATANECTAIYCIAKSALAPAVFAFSKHPIRCHAAILLRTKQLRQSTFLSVTLLIVRRFFYFFVDRHRSEFVLMWSFKISPHLKRVATARPCDL